MPSLTALKKTFCVLTLITAAYFAFANASFLNLQKLSRQPASIEMKNISLKPTNEPLIRTYKLLPPLEIKLSNLNQEEFPPQTPFTLQATINVLKPIASADYHWVLPETVTLLTGGNSTDLHGTLTQLSPQQDKIISATFISSSAVNEKIHLRVTLREGENNMTQTAQYNTRDQKELDKARVELAERNNEYLLEHPELLKKAN